MCYFPTASQILPNFYLSDEYTATSPRVLDDLGITHMVSVQSSHFDYKGRFQCYNATVEQADNPDIMQVLPGVVGFIKDGLAFGSNARLLVHGKLGVNISASIVLGYLISCQFMTCDSAIAYLKSRRSFVAPRAGLYQQLKKWEQLTRMDREKHLADRLGDIPSSPCTPIWTDAPSERLGHIPRSPCTPIWTDVMPERQTVLVK